MDTSEMAREPVGLIPPHARRVIEVVLRLVGSPEGKVAGGVDQNRHVFGCHDRRAAEGADQFCHPRAQVVAAPLGHLVRESLHGHSTLSFSQFMRLQARHVTRAELRVHLGFVTVAERHPGGRPAVYDEGLTDDEASLR